MKIAKLFIASTFLLAFAVCVSAQKSKNTTIKLTEKDKSEILKQVFADGFEKLMKDKGFSQCTIPIVSDEKIILIETNEPSIFPKLTGEYRFKFLNGKEIENEIKDNNGDCYFKINNFQAVNSKTVKITLWRWVEVVTVVNGKSWYPSRWVAASGLTYKAKKVGGKWNTKFLDSAWAVS